jgi:hypothetical protein
MAPDMTFVFGDDKVYAMADGQVVAASDDLDELEDELDEDEEEAPKKKASSTIVTPGGLKGTILGRTPDMWGLSETLTVRLENGRIAHYAFADVTEAEDEEKRSPIDSLEEELSDDVPGDRDSLEKRKEQLSSLKRQAHTLVVGGLSDGDMGRIDRLVIEADAELAEIGERVDMLDAQAADEFQPPAPFDINVVEQGGRPDGAGWLDVTMQDMVNEAEQYDFGKLMDEGPEAFVAEQDTAALADQGTTQAIAASFINSKVAAADPAIREKYTNTWLARVEGVRREELQRRKAEQTRQAKIAHEENSDAPDESLFL